MNWSAFSKNEQGSIAIIGALTLMALLGISGAAVDYAFATKARQRIDALADAAALVAVGNSSRTLSAAQAKTRAEDTFRTSFGSEPGVTLTSVSAAVSDTDTGRQITLTYGASYRTSFMQAFGWSTLPLKSTIVATGNVPVYMDFHVLVDNSPSMGLGATQADIDTLKAQIGCAFGCHVIGDANDYYTKVRNIGAKMRIDTVRIATQSLMDTATTVQTVSNQFGVALYTFGPTAKKEKLTEIHARSTNLTAAKSAAGTIDLMALEYWGVKGYAMTDLEGKFKALNGKVSAPGDGRTPGAPQQVVMFVSDGVADWNNSACKGKQQWEWDPDAEMAFQRCFEPMNTSYCDTLKDRGIRIAVLHTLYLPMPGEWAYDAFVAPMADQIPAAMKSCASEGLYFAVAPHEGIEDAMKALFLKTVQTVKLTR